MDYEKMTVKALREETLKRELGLRYLRELKKVELVEALTRDDKGMTPSPPLAGWDDFGRQIAFNKK